MSLIDRIVNQNADQRTVGQIIAEESEDMREGWIIEACARGVWRPAWETWFVDDKEEVERIEKAASKKGESPNMQPRSFTVLLEELKKRRPVEEWDDYRFCNVNTGMVIHACILK